MIAYKCFTSAGVEEGVAAKVGELHHHTVVHHTVGGLEATVDLDGTGMEVGHALQRRHTGEQLTNQAAGDKHRR